MSTPPLNIVETSAWDTEAARELYHVDRWGAGYFGIDDAGHAVVHPAADPSVSIDLKSLVDQLAVRGIEPPVLVRFTDILRHRIGRIADAFAAAIAEYDYRGAYACVYPIKVNQQRHVAEEVRDFGAAHGFGLEAGSKPELLAVLAMTATQQTPKDTPIVCNGFKDDEFIETIVLTQKIGKLVIPIVEKYSELDLIVKHAEAHGVKPMIGVRVKLSSRGAGRWSGSGGVRSKFGLFVSEVVEMFEHLNDRGMGDCLKLVHCHLGSQISNIRMIKDGVEELTRVYVALKQMGAGLEYLDVGGGLGVDYDGSATDDDSSINYSLDEYAKDIIWRIKTVCDEWDIDHPTVFSESGRATVAHHSVMVMNTLGVAKFDSLGSIEELPEIDREDDDTPQPLIDLYDALADLTEDRSLEVYHDATAAYEQSLNLFKLGYMSLPQRALAERIFWAVCSRIVAMTRIADDVPAELEDLPQLLLDTYFINVSVFQSLPDSWAIDQRFPIMPIHRLDERPTRRAMLADITCDSDGRIDRFVSPTGEDDRSLLLHNYTGEPYLLGAFLVGAYQETLGDLHNLFGDTHVVHVELDDDNQVVVNHVVRGDTVREVLGYVEFNADEMLNDVRRQVERAVRRGRLTLEESAQFMRLYEDGLNGYTYLE